MPYDPITRPATRIDRHLDRWRTAWRNSRAARVLGPIGRFIDAWSKHFYHLFLWINIAGLWAVAGLAMYGFIATHAADALEPRTLELFFGIIDWMTRAAIAIGIGGPIYWALKERWTAWRSGGDADA